MPCLRIQGQAKQPNAAVQNSGAVRYGDLWCYVHKWWRYGVDGVGLAVSFGSDGGVQLKRLARITLMAHVKMQR